MNDLVKAAGLAKARVDAGFSRVGRGLSASSPVDGALTALAARAVSVGDALVVLCRGGHASEALPLLRAVAEFALTMRWVAAADSAARAERALESLRAPGWESLWPAAPARRRAGEFGVPPGAVAAALDSAPDFARGNAQGLPWGHVFADRLLPAREPEPVLAAAVEWLALALEALDRRWPGSFPGAAEMRDAARTSRG